MRRSTPSTTCRLGRAPLSWRISLITMRAASSTSVSSRKTHGRRWGNRSARVASVALVPAASSSCSVRDTMSCSASPSTSPRYSSCGASEGTTRASLSKTAAASPSAGAVLERRGQHLSVPAGAFASSPRNTRTSVNFRRRMLAAVRRGHGRWQSWSHEALRHTHRDPRRQGRSPWPPTTTGLQVPAGCLRRCHPTLERPETAPQTRH